MSPVVQNAIGFCKGVGPKSNTSFCEGSTSRKERRTNYSPLACFFPFFLFLVDFSTSAYVALSSPAKNFTQAYKKVKHSQYHNDALCKKNENKSVLLVSFTSTLCEIQ